MPMATKRIPGRVRLFLSDRGVPGHVMLGMA